MEVADYQQCPACETDLIRRIAGWWCPRCRGWLHIERRSHLSDDSTRPIRTIQSIRL